MKNSLYENIILTENLHKKGYITFYSKKKKNLTLNSSNQNFNINIKNRPIFNNLKNISILTCKNNKSIKKQKNIKLITLKNSIYFLKYIKIKQALLKLENLNEIQVFLNIIIYNIIISLISNKNNNFIEQEFKKKNQSFKVGKQFYIKNVIFKTRKNFKLKFNYFLYKNTSIVPNNIKFIENFLNKKEMILSIQKLKDQTKIYKNSFYILKKVIKFKKQIVAKIKKKNRQLNLKLKKKRKIKKYQNLQITIYKKIATHLIFFKKKKKITVYYSIKNCIDFLKNILKKRYNEYFISLLSLQHNSVLNNFVKNNNLKHNFHPFLNFYIKSYKLYITNQKLKHIYNQIKFEKLFKI